MGSHRYNVFALIHKGLRGLLYNTALRLQQADLGRVDEGSAAIQQVEVVILLFEKHAENEDKFLLPAAMQHEPDVATDFRSEHQEDQRLGEKLRTGIDAWKRSDNDHERTDAGKNIFYTLNDFAAFNLAHMNKEEKLLNKILWQHYRDDEIRLFEQAMIRNTPPDLLSVSAKWIIRSVSDPELTRWLTDVRQHASPELFLLLTALGKSELSPKRWQSIVDNAGTG
jgi:hemerythrin-like domain-containing protein